MRRAAIGMMDHGNIRQLGQRAEQNNIGDDAVGGLAASVADDTEADVGTEEALRDDAGVEACYWVGGSAICLEAKCFDWGEVTDERALCVGDAGEHLSGLGHSGRRGVVLGELGVVVEGVGEVGDGGGHVGLGFRSSCY